MSRLPSSALTVALAGALVAAAYTDVLLVAAAVVVVQALIASAPTLADAHGRSIATPRFVPALAGGLVATLIAVRPQVIPGADGTGNVVGFSDTGVLAGIVPAVAVTVFVALICQMLRKDGRSELTASTAYAVSLGVSAALASGWIGGSQSLAGASTVAIGAAGVGAGVLVWAIPGHRLVLAVVSVVAGAAGGAVAAATVDTVVTVIFGGMLGAAAAVLAILGQVLGRAWASSRSHVSSGWAFPGAMSLALAAPIVYVGGQLVASSVI